MLKGYFKGIIMRNKPDNILPVKTEVINLVGSRVFDYIIMLNIVDLKTLVV